MSKSEETDVDKYNEKHGRDTHEEEFDDITTAVHGDIGTSERVLNLVNYFTESISQLETLDYLDAPVAVDVINNKICDVNKELGLELPDVMIDEQGVLSTEGVISTIAEITTILFRLSMATFQRTSLAISRLSKSVEGLENRLDKLDAIMKRRETEDLRIRLSNKHMVNLVMQQKMTGSPVSDATRFVTSVGSVVNVLNGYIKKILERASSIYKSAGDDKFDVKEFESIEEEFIGRLEDIVDKDNVMLGNRVFHYAPNRLLGKSIIIKTLDRPSPSKVLKGQYFIKSLTNDTIEDYRTSLIEDTLDKLYTLLDDTSKMYKELSESKTQGRKHNDGMEEKDVKELANYINTNVSAVMDKVTELSKLCYEIVNTVVTYMEESAQQEGKDVLMVKKEERDTSDTSRYLL